VILHFEVKSTINQQFRYNDVTQKAPFLDLKKKRKNVSLIL